jgi:putative endonuclease
MAKGGWVYIMASQRNGTLYIGVTSDISRRAWEHREGLVEGFTKIHGCKMLVWIDRYEKIEDAIGAEKRMKEWHRAWKLRAIEERNPDWDDLYLSLND